MSENSTLPGLSDLLMVQSPLCTSAARFFSTNTTTHDAKTRYASVRRILITHLLRSIYVGPAASAVPARAKPGANRTISRYRLWNPEFPTAAAESASATLGL